MEFIDTHCHIHFPDYPLDSEQVMQDAHENNVTQMICVGCTLADSQKGIEFAKRYENVYASIGLHPHEAEDYTNNPKKLQQFRNLLPSPHVVAIGEIGLDYYYEHSPKEAQKQLLQFQLDMAIEHKLPVIFHVREAFDDFWSIFDQYSDISGVIHSFSASTKELDQIIERGLYVGLNGIMTFTKDANQLAAAKAVPLDKLVLETDAPYLTPVPFRGKICEPKHVRVTAEFLSSIRSEDLASIAAATTRNARQLFQL